MNFLYDNLLDQIAVNGENTAKWVAASKTYFQAFIDSDPILKQFAEKITIVMHGSTTRNIDDAHSDLDFWLVLNDKEYENYKTITEQSFIPYEKWLYVQANFHETPKSLIENIDNIIVEIKRDPAS